MFESTEVCKESNIEMEVHETKTSPDTRLSVKIRCLPCSIDQSEAEMKGFGLIIHQKVMEKIMLKEDKLMKFTVSLSFI